MEFVLLGEMQGRTVRIGGFAFRNGVCQVSDDVQAVTTATNILTRFHNAHPGHLVEHGVGGKLQLRDSGPEEVPGAVDNLAQMPSMAGSGEPELVPELDDAGGAIEDTGKGAKPGKRDKK